jgi:predicted RND superfamily exporter protein
MFGIGLDDAFIIFGEYVRTDPKKDSVQRIADTFDEVGLSIFLTTFTTTVAFGLGCTTELPMIQWLSFYAFTTVAIDFIYQISFFVALIVIDEQRIKRQKKLRSEGQTVCLCIAIKTEDLQEDNQEEYGSQNGNTSSENDCDNAESLGALHSGVQEQPQLLPQHHQLGQLTGETHCHHLGPPSSVMDRMMRWYANVLMLKLVKVLVIVAFIIFNIICVYSATQFTQEFNIYDTLSRDSYVTAYLKGLDEYADRGFVVPQAYFRDVDQSNPEIQQQMENFVNELAEMDSIANQPPYFWLRHFQEFLTYDDRLIDLTFKQQMDIFLSIEAFRLLYGDHIIRDPDSGDIIASRCVMYMDNIDMGSISSQIQAFEDQMYITETQPINSDDFTEGSNGFNFFLFDDYMLYGWEFYAMMVDELVLNTILTILAVCTIIFMFLPHWTATLFLTPIISMCYIDLIGMCFWVIKIYVCPASTLTLVCACDQRLHSMVRCAFGPYVILHIDHVHWSLG